MTSENYPNDFTADQTCDAYIRLAGDQKIVLTFEDFELKKYGDWLQIFDTLVSTIVPLNTFMKFDTLNSMEPLTLSGNKGIIRLTSRACPYYSKDCDTGRGFKIKVGVGKSTIVLLIA